ncbi:putative Endothelin-converting enzyme 1 [Hypsibius exemplaris]|uniref:Endothelin-converting enzyme 1 n=1 Tax=Hypsibius exemplaris TaxID=2072580 RepID=A0A9X6NBE8_HYPEX|nr:putative Endothelin-converting enzyme 1 [Hypsibius exemplaris]
MNSAMGSKYDEEGNETDWWTAEFLQQFEQRQADFVVRYNNYTLPDVDSVIGALTLDENIVDEIGIKAAYKVYQNFRKTEAHPFKVPIEFSSWSPNQLFFLGYAQGESTTYTTKSLQHQLKDEDSPAKFCVNGPLSVMPQFAEAYNCPVGFPMNLPRVTCKSLNHPPPG